MSQLVFELSVTCGLVGALLAGVAALAQGHGLWTLAQRSLISGGIFFLFGFLGAQFVARALLERAAQRQLANREPEEAAEDENPPADFLEAIRQTSAQPGRDRGAGATQPSATARESQPNRQAA